MKCPNCQKKLETPHQVHNCMVPGALVERLRKALDAATDVGIYPMSVVTGGKAGGYKNRTEFMKGWNAHSIAAIKEVEKVLKPGDWEDK